LGLSQPHQFGEALWFGVITQLAWQEGHTAHATKEEATEMVEAALDLYASACAKRLADSPRLKVEHKPMQKDWKGIPYQVK